MKKASQCVDTFPRRRISRGGNESSSAFHRLTAITVSYFTQL